MVSVPGFHFVKLSSTVVSGGAGLVLDMPHLGGSPLWNLTFARR